MPDEPAPRRRTRATRTSAFGVSQRISHDSSRFYNSALYDGRSGKSDIAYVERPVPAEHLDRIHCQSSEQMSQLPDCSVHLMVTSPPYNVGKEYDEDLSLDAYRGLLRSVWRETYRVLVPGGRACINVANLGRKPYIPLHAFIIQDAEDCGFLMRGEIIWDKGSSGISSTAWGSWLSPRNPTLRDVHEYILVFNKETFSRPAVDGRGPTIDRDQFLALTQSVWHFPPESARRVGHPAPFPVELPYRLIQLYTFEGEVVLDPFAGSGSTAVAAVRSGRHFVGYDLSPDYVALAEERIRREREPAVEPTRRKRRSTAQPGAAPERVPEAS